ncbi:MAG: hypothetical protein K0Q81_1522 [Paenibacillus sp.]|nr:hypothetical protein [Paenibacillus sp.]
MTSKRLLKNRFFYFVAVLLCLFYAYIMIQLLFNRGSSAFSPTYRYNLIPFKTISNYVVNFSHFNFEIWFKNLFGNIVMFIPIGVFAPILNKRYLRFFPFLGFTFLILTAVETIQLISRVGSFDVDDLILNLFGAIIGYLFLRGLIK